MKEITKIQGYKAFSLDHNNCYGVHFEVGQYHIDGPIVFGTNGTGYHFSKNLEDTIRFAGDPDPKGVRDVAIAVVIGSGDIVESYDSYGGFYELYSASDLEIVKFLTREEIIEIGLSLTGMRLKRFVSYFKLEEEELKYFTGINLDIDLAIDYYQKNIDEAYNRDYILNKFQTYNNIKKEKTYKKI